MSYIECKSFVTGKENVQYPLIDVELTHKIKNEHIACNCDSSSTYWNTAPQPIATYKYNINKYGNIEKLYVDTRGITGRKSQGYNASGELLSNYTYVPTGPFPIISQQIINESNLKEGVNTFDLFETTNVKVILEVAKLKEHEVHPSYNHTYIDLDGTTIEDPDIIASITVVQILKSNNKVISQIEMSRFYLQRSGIAVPIEFTINTTLFRIKNFNPKYATSGGYNSRYGMWLDNPSGTRNKLYNEGVITENEGDFIGMQFSVYATEYWSGNTPSGNNTCYRCKIINADGSEVTNKNKKKLNTDAIKAWINNEINVNPNTFINFLIDYGANGGGDMITNPELYTFAESYSNGDKGYKIKSYKGEEDIIYGSHNMFISPIVAPYVMSDYSVEDQTRNSDGIYIPLTSTVFEGDPVNPDDPVDPDEPETTEPADDPNTDYTPDVSEGEEDFQYPPGAVIGGLPAALNAYRPSYSNYLFSKYYKSNKDDNDNASSFIQDAANPSAFELWGTTFKLITGHPTPGEIISRVYMLPFEYNEIRGTDSAGFAYSAPVYGPIGPVTLGAKNYSEVPNQTGEPETDNVHYYLQIMNRFITLDLGTVTIERVFNNYLDYTETKYTLNLPYAAGKIELDPDYLFMNGRISGTVKLIGYVDIDTGELTITVQLNNQLYYQTTVNVAIDRLATVNDNLATPLAISKAVMASAATAGGLSKMMSKKQPDRSKEYEEMRTAEIIKRQQNETAEIAKRTSIQEEASMRILKARKEGGL